MYLLKHIIIAITLCNSLIKNAKCYLNRRFVYTSNKPVIHLYMVNYSNEELELSVKRHIEGLIRKSKDFNLDDDVEEGEVQSIYPPPGDISKSTVDRIEDSTSKNDEEINKIPKSPDIKPMKTPETFLPSMVQLPEYNDEEWSPNFYIGNFKSPGPEFIEKNNDFLLEWANIRRKSRGLSPIKVKWKKLPDHSYLNDKAFNLQNCTEIITSETRPENGNYTCSDIWKIPELQEEYNFMKKNLLNRKEVVENDMDIGEKNKSFYDNLPRDEHGFAIFDQIKDIERLSFEEVKCELIARGYRTHGNFNQVKERLLDSFNDPHKEWRIKNIVSKKLSKDNMELSEEVRDKLKQIEDKEKFLETIEESDDLKEFQDKIAAFSELSQYYEDPIGYLNLDFGIDIQGLTESEIEELKNAPRIEDLHFHKKMNAPEVDFVDRLEKTFNFEENRPQRPLPTYNEEATIYEMKKKFLEIEEGFHEHNVKMIVERFGVSEAFVVDALCKLGANVPIDPTEPIKRYIDYNAIWNFLEYLNIVDPIDTQVFYSIDTLEDIAEEYDIPIDDLIDACKKIKVKLPYGTQSQLNMQCKSAMLHHLYKRGKLLNKNFPNPYLKNHPILTDSQTNDQIIEYETDDEILSDPSDDE